ncbi:hypothetical protein JCM10212_005824 [Sporobolomyces blumeae]
MALRSSKDWRRSRTQSFFGDLGTPPASPNRRPLNSAHTRRAVRLPYRIRLPATLVLVTGSFICFLLLFRSSNGTSAQIHLAKDYGGAYAEHPNFDFDLHAADSGRDEADLRSRDRDGSDLEQERDEARANDDGQLEGDDENAGDDSDDDPNQIVWTKVPERDDEGVETSPPAARPFLPFSCAPCTSTAPIDSLAPPTCAKYGSRARPSTTTPTSSTFEPSPLRPGVLDQSVLFSGTGADVRRVLKRAMKSSLYGTKREAEGKEEDSTKFEDEEPFRILVLGGSVSNCRGVDPKTSCWHTHVLRWFQQALPMEGDRDLVPDVPSLLASRDSPGPSRLGDVRVRRSVIPLANDTLPPRPSTSPPRRREKRAVGRGKSKKKQKKKTKKKASTVSSRRRPSTRLIDGSKSATGSAFFAYCFEEEMTLRRKNVDWGKGPDLVLLEFGVNDVYPHDEVATRDFEKLLRTLRSLPSNPAIVALEAASLLLASTTSFTSNAEYLHLPAAQFYDVPVLSAKQALFGPQPPFSASSTLKMRDLFLPDQHHPNDRGHEFLADILVSYLEEQACVAQAEILETATARLASSESIAARSSVGAVVQPELDIIRRREEALAPLPSRSLFTPFPTDDKAVQPWKLPQPRCIQVGNSKSTVEPIRISGWEKYAWARDKQYLIADKPGSTVTYRVVVGEGGTILADWLRSRFYDLGDVSVYLDGDRSKAVTLAGYWNLGWSIGVPTEIFTSVAAGPHDVTFEILPASRSSHPNRKTHFRLVGLIST